MPISTKDSAVATCHFGGATLYVETGQHHAAAAFPLHAPVCILERMDNTTIVVELVQFTSNVAKDAFLRDHPGWKVLHDLSAEEYLKGTVVFERGNARIIVKNLEPWAEYVAVNYDGTVYQFESPPQDLGLGRWNSANEFDYTSICGAVGMQCPDWRDLLFVVERR